MGDIAQKKYSVLAAGAYERIRRLNHELKALIEEARSINYDQMKEIERLKAENDELRKVIEGSQ